MPYVTRTTGGRIPVPVSSHEATTASDSGHTLFPSSFRCHLSHARAGPFLAWYVTCDLFFSPPALSSRRHSRHFRHPRLPSLPHSIRHLRSAWWLRRIVHVGASARWGCYWADQPRWISGPDGAGSARDVRRGYASLGQSHPAGLPRQGVCLRREQPNEGRRVMCEAQRRASGRMHFSGREEDRGAGEHVSIHATYRCNLSMQPPRRVSDTTQQQAGRQTCSIYPV